MFDDVLQTRWEEGVGKITLLHGTLKTSRCQQREVLVFLTCKIKMHIKLTKKKRRRRDRRSSRDKRFAIK